MVESTVLDRHVDCLKEMAKILDQFDLSGDIKLMFTPGALELQAGEVLVQRLDRGSRQIVLEPIGINDLKDGDVLHESQVIDPADEELVRYASSVQAGSCLTRYDLKGNKVHIYE